jgi:hypothetical protein
VVEVAAGCRHPAAGALAGAVPGDHEVAHPLRGLVGVHGDVEELPDGVGEKTPPHPVAGDPAGDRRGDRAGADQLGGLVVGAEQG